MKAEQRRVARRLRRTYGLGSGPAMIYLVCFADQPLAHARHYLGYVGRYETLGDRLERHRSGSGSALLRAVAGSGRHFEVTFTLRLPLRVARGVERSIKNCKNLASFCPRCAAEHRRRRAAEKRRQRCRESL